MHQTIPPISIHSTQNSSPHYLPSTYHITIPSHMQSKFSNINSISENGLFAFQQGRKVKPKMIVKLFDWMEKTSKEALDFSDKTFQVSTKITLKYLKKVDESPRELQIIGCAALHLASKINEKTIISAVSYCEASKNSFTRQDLEAKQKLIYNTLDYNINFTTLHGVIDFFGVALKLEKEQMIKLKEFRKFLVKDAEFWNFSVSTIVQIMVIELKNENILCKQNLLTYLKHKF